MIDQSPGDLVGREIGPCRLEELLGLGGMAAVYRAHHKPLDRQVAVKIPFPSLRRGEGQTDLFLREARAAAKLEDPRIVTVYDAGRQDPYCYIIMQLVKGETLERRVLRQGPLPQKEALRVMKEVLLGLEAAHGQGIIHRDIKPGNIMLEPSGGVKIMDFGIAAAAGSLERIAEEPVMGSFDFMAPEQAFATAPDPRMDLYAVGASYFFALTGRPPFTGASATEILIKHRETPPPDVRELNREATQGAARLIARLMEKFPESRPASAQETLKLLGAPGMLMEVDSSGSPFKILPPPLEAPQGFVPPPSLERAGEPAPEPGAASSLESSGMDVGAGGFPDPPPPVAYGPPPMGALDSLVGLGLFAVFFAAPWRGAVPADCLAAAACAALWAAGMAFGDNYTWPRKLAGCFLLACLVLSCYAYGLLSGRAPASWPLPLELAILSGLGLALGLVGLYLGFLDPIADRGLPAGLWLSAAGFLLAAGILRGAEESLPWGERLKVLIAEEAGRLRATGGLWRWGGLWALYGAFWIWGLSAVDASRWSRPRSTPR